MERLGVRWIEVGRQGTAGAASDGGFARLCSRELEEGKGMDGTGSFPGLREEKSGAQTVWASGVHSGSTGAAQYSF